IKAVVSALWNTQGLNWPSSFEQQRQRTGDLDMLDWLKAILFSLYVSYAAASSTSQQQQKKKKEKKKDPLRIFYESLYEQVPTSEIDENSEGNTEHKFQEQPNLLRHLHDLLLQYQHQRQH
ncbi:hypothetical protein HN51_062459, partial [Arachis hypogaea]